MTKAVYADDYNAVASQFDDAMRSKVSRGEVGMLSDKVRALGTYDWLALVASAPVKNEYAYRATFSNGTTNVVVRLDPNGRLAAYLLIAK